MCCVLRTGLQLLLFGSDFIENNVHIAVDVKKGLKRVDRDFNLWDVHIPNIGSSNDDNRLQLVHDDQ